MSSFDGSWPPHNIQSIPTASLALLNTVYCPYDSASSPFLSILQLVLIATCKPVDIAAIQHDILAWQPALDALLEEETRHLKFIL